MAKRRSPGLGTVEKLPSGKYRVRMVGPNGKRLSSPTFSTKEEAERTRKSLLAVLCEEKIAPSRGITLGQFAEKWLDRRLNRSGDTELVNFRTHVFSSQIAGISLSELQKRDIKEFLHELSQKKSLVTGKGGQKKAGKEFLKATTQSRIFNILRKCLSDATEDGLISENAASGLRVKRQSVGGKKINYLRDDEIDKLLTCEEIPIEFRLLYQFAIYTGLRKGEIWPLEWEDVDLLGRYPRVTVCRSHNRGTKSDKTRIVPLLSKAFDALNEIQTKHFIPSDWVFPNDDGTKRSAKYRARWNEHKNLAGITRKLTFHDLRHTCASHLLMGTWGETWSIYEVKEFLGHKSITSTQIYAHLSPDHLHKKAKATFTRFDVHTKSMTKMQDFRSQEKKYSVNEYLEEIGTRRIELRTPTVSRLYPPLSNQALTNPCGLRMDIKGQNLLVWLSISLLQFSANETPPPTSLIELLTVQAESLFQPEHPARLEIGRIRSGSFVLSSAIRLAEHVLSLFQAQGEQEVNHG